MDNFDFDIDKALNDLEKQETLQGELDQIKFLCFKPF